MRYLGGKVKIGRWLVDAMLADLGVKRIGLAADLCSGGGGLTHRLADVSDRVIAVEYHAGLVELMRAVQAGWVPPSSVTREEYHATRAGDPLAPLTAFVGFGVSFGGKLWGGYAAPSPPRRGVMKGDNPARESAKTLVRDARANVEHVCADATTWEPPAGLEVAYIDPPYEGTTGYSGAPALPPGTWWRKAQALADAGIAVYVSEYAGPPAGVDARIVWERAKGCMVTKTASGLDARSAKTSTRTERLWRVLPSEEWDSALEREVA